MEAQFMEMINKLA